MARWAKRWERWSTAAAHLDEAALGCGERRARRRHVPNERRTGRSSWTEEHGVGKVCRGGSSEDEGELSRGQDRQQVGRGVEGARPGSSAVGQAGGISELGRIQVFASAHFRHRRASHDRRRPSRPSAHPCWRPPSLASSLSSKTPLFPRHGRPRRPPSNPHLPTAQARLVVQRASAALLQPSLFGRSEPAAFPAFSPAAQPSCVGLALTPALSLVRPLQAIAFPLLFNAGLLAINTTQLLRASPTLASLELRKRPVLTLVHAPPVLAPQSGRCRSSRRSGGPSTTSPGRPRRPSASC